MDVKLRSRTIPSLLLIIAGTLAAGTVNGLLGTGGGIILTYIFAYTSRYHGMSPADRFAASMMVTIPTSLISLTTYSSEYLKDTRFIVSLALASALGGIMGAYVSNRVKPSLLNKIFAYLVI